MQQQRWRGGVPGVSARVAALRTGVVLALLGFVVACGAGDPAAADLVPPVGRVPLRSPYAPDTPGLRSSTPVLAADGDSGVLLVWTEHRADSSYALMTNRWQPNDWTQPRVITTGRDLFVNWADLPSIVRLPDGTLAAHWLQREGSAKYAYGIRVARSADSGLTWSAPVTPHTDGLPAEHGFVSLWAADSGSVGAVWLDGRKMAMKDSTEETMLRTARIRPDGTLADEAVLDARICDCCQTATAATRQGRVIVYRDRSPEDVRDIGIVRQVNGQWTTPALVHADGWVINGCPVNGPAVATRGDTVAVAWFTRARDTAQVLVALSRDAGATFEPPVRVDEGDPLGRVAVVVDDRGYPVVSWLERQSASGALVLVRRVGVDGRRSAVREVAIAGADRAAGFPRMILARDSLLFAWVSKGLQGGQGVLVKTVPVR